MAHEQWLMSERRLEVRRDPVCEESIETNRLIVSDIECDKRERQKKGEENVIASTPEKMSKSSWCRPCSASRPRCDLAACESTSTDTSNALIVTA